jgi:outer membrane protein assembly factor BamB
MPNAQSAHSVPSRHALASARRPALRVVSPIVVVLALFATNSTAYCDWPQVLGPNRNGKSLQAEPLKADWPAALTPVWSQNIGNGYGGPAVVQDSVFILHRIGSEEFLEALDVATGKQRWRTGWKATYASSIDPDNGPRCVPTIAGDKAICYGAAGDLACVQTGDGKLLWSRAIRREFNAEDGYFGAGTSPLVIGDLVIVGVGGPKAGIVGIDLETGKNRWVATGHDASYAAPIQLKQLGKSGKPLALVVTRLKTVLLDSADGSVLSEVNFGSRGPTVNAATPIEVAENQFLLTASYGIGSTLLSTAKNKLTETYSKNQLLSSQYNTPVFVNDRIIGIDGREDAGSSTLRSFDPQTRKTIWEQDGFSTSHLIAVGNQVLVVSVDGSIQLIDANAETYKPLAKSKLPAGKYRALPALSDGVLFLRKTTGPNNSQCIAIEL